jgi:hypothetical protein
VSSDTILNAVRVDTEPISLSVNEIPRRKEEIIKSRELIFC